MNPIVLTLIGLGIGVSTGFYGFYHGRLDNSPLTRYSESKAKK